MTKPLGSSGSRALGRHFGGLPKLRMERAIRHWKGIETNHYTPHSDLWLDAAPQEAWWVDKTAKAGLPPPLEGVVEGCRGICMGYASEMSLNHYGLPNELAAILWIGHWMLCWRASGKVLVPHLLTSTVGPVLCAPKVSWPIVFLSLS